MTTCPVCERGTLNKAKEPHVMFGVDLGSYKGEKCTSCGEVFTDSVVMKKIEEVARQKGILGRVTKTRRTQNSTCN